MSRKAKRKEDDYASDDNLDGKAPTRKSSKKDSDDESDDVLICEISKNRRVSVRNWQGKIVVDIHEFYVKDGKQLPGKKTPYDGLKMEEVVANCLSALQEIWSSEARTSEEASRMREALLSKPIIHIYIYIYIYIYYFLNRIREFNEWAQSLILDLVAKYVPPDSNDIFDIMNLLEDRLQHANGAVVLATIKVFPHLTLSMANTHQQSEATKEEIDALRATIKRCRSQT